MIFEKVLAIDLGLKRIGLALSSDGTIVTPLSAVLRKNRNQAAQEVKRILDEWQIQSIVMGIPMDGGETEAEMRRRTTFFIQLLDFKGDVFYQDESFSSLEAQELMKGEIRQKKDGRIDSLAAKIILERFLNERKS